MGSRAAPVVISKESIYTSFTPEIDDWTADKELNFSQTEEEEGTTPDSGDQVLEHCRLIIKVNKAIDWYDKYVYSWDADETKLSGEWPGTKTEWEKEDGNYHIYHHDFPASLNGKTINYIINGGLDQPQTKDLSVTLNGAETTVVIETNDKQ